MADIGIDKISFYTPHYYLDLKDLAKVRKVDPGKYTVGLGQEKMSVLPPNEDIVTMAVNATINVFNDVEELKDIDVVLFATESGIDYSKSAGLYLHKLLKLKSCCRVIELKQACYSAVMGLQLALSWVYMNPNSKVILVASDVSRYGLGTPGEPTQGSGAVAMIISSQPKILRIEQEFGLHTHEIMDFWRPNACEEAIVDGPLSTETYLDFLNKTWEQYKEVSGRKLFDFSAICYHTPFTKMVKKAHYKLIHNNFDDDSLANLEHRFNAALNYSRLIGNSYTASLFINFCSLIDNSDEDLSKQRVGFYSYGSGSIAEFFSGVLKNGYKNNLKAKKHYYCLANRNKLNVEEYEKIYKLSKKQQSRSFVPPVYDTDCCRLYAIKDYKRYYEMTL